MGVFIALAATLLYIWLDSNWPFIVAGAIFLYLVVSNLIIVRKTRQQDHTRAVVDELLWRERDD